MDGKIYQFGDYLLDITEQRLQKNGEDISLPPKVFEVLTALIKRHGQLISYQELMDEVWHDTFVEETNLRYSIHTLRKTFDEDFIETVPKRGYRFNAEVEVFTAEEFIKKHTGNFKKDELMRSVDEETSAKPKSAFGKYAAIAATTLLMMSIGLAAFYFWQNGEKTRENNSAKTIMVLPFKLIGADLGQNPHLEKGLIGSIVFDLNKIKGLKAINSTDVQNNSEKKSDLQLEGSYHYDSERSIQVNFRLLPANGGADLMTGSVFVKDADKNITGKIISLRIARKVFDKMASLADEEFLKTQNLNEEAAKNYLIGQQILRNYDYDRQKEGIEAFEKVIETEPDWAKGYAKFAEASVLLHGAMPDWKRAKEFAEKALEIDENLAEAHLALGKYYQSEFDWETAEKSFARAIELNPGYSEAYNEYGFLLDVQRKFAEAEKMFLKATRLKPFDPFYFSSICKHYYYDKKSDFAVKNCREAENLDSSFTLPDKHLFWIYVDQGDYPAVFKNEFGDLTESEVERDLLAKPLKDGNIKLYWQRRIEDRLENQKRRYSPQAIASFYAQLQDKENTLKYLEEMDKLLPTDIFFVNPDPTFDFVRKDPRFINLLKKRNLQP